MLPENYIYERIEELCEQKHMSKYRLAMNAGMSLSSISTLMHRKSIPTIQTLDKLCDGFGITLAQFFTAEGMPGLTEEQQKVLDVWASLDEREKELINAYILGMKNK